MGGPIDYVMEVCPGAGFLRFQDEERFHPVDCKHVECLEKGTEGSCSFHLDYMTHSRLAECMLDYDRYGPMRKEGGKGKVKKVKEVLSAIVFA